MGDRNEYMFHTSDEDASPVISRLGYLYRRKMRVGLVHAHSCRRFCCLLSPSSSLLRLWWIVSGRKKKIRRHPAPASAVCSQKITRQLRNVTITPPIRGPKAGPISVPLRNQPRAVDRWVWLLSASETRWQACRFHLSGDRVGGMEAEEALIEGSAKSTTYRMEDVANTRGADNDETRALKGGQHSENEKGGEVGRERGANRKGKEQDARD